jgi:2-polyprenyl-6-methoxyphenol hydroxylase-like FAD-dependent oxidoreductase
MRDADAEAIVVGGGPAGSTLAAALAQSGHCVLLLDKAAFPRHKPCSDYVNAGGRKILAGMGVLDEAMRAGAHRIDGMIVHAPDGNRFTAAVSISSCSTARRQPGSPSANEPTSGISSATASESLVSRQQSMVL